MIRLVFRVEDAAGRACLGSQIRSEVHTFDFSIPLLEDYIREKRSIQYLSCELVGFELLDNPQEAPRQ